MAVRKSAKITSSRWWKAFGWEAVKKFPAERVQKSERVQKIEVLDVYRDAASVKVVTGRWIDYMHLSKMNGEWRVLDVVLQYTRR